MNTEAMRYIGYLTAITWGIVAIIEDYTQLNVVFELINSILG